MKSRIFALLLVLVMAAMMLTGCDLFTTGNSEPTGNNEPANTAAPTENNEPADSAAPAESSEPTESGEDAGDAVVLTDKYSFVDPEGLEYDKRYVIYFDENSLNVSSAIQAGYGMKANYTIIYADADDAPLLQVDFIVCNSEEDAVKVAEFYAAQGQNLAAVEEDPSVLTVTTDGETVEATLLMLQSMSVLSETTVSAYVEYSASTGGTVK